MRAVCSTYTPGRVVADSKRQLTLKYTQLFIEAVFHVTISEIHRRRRGPSERNVRMNSAHAMKFSPLVALIKSAEGRNESENSP